MEISLKLEGLTNTIAAQTQNLILRHTNNLRDTVLNLFVDTINVTITTEVLSLLCLVTKFMLKKIYLKNHKKIGYIA